MVTCYHHFMRVWKGVQPIDLGLEFCWCAGLSEIACVDEKIAVGDIFWDLAVCV